MANNFSLIYHEAKQCKKVLEQVLSYEPLICSKSEQLTNIVQTVLFGMCDKIQKESLSTTAGAGIIKSLMSNIALAYENLFEVNEMYFKEFLNGHRCSNRTTFLDECKELLKEVIESLNHVIQVTKGSVEADIFWVTEVCPECDNENTFVWDVEAQGYKVHCPNCGAEMMLCDACSNAEDNLNPNCDNCNWSSDKSGKASCFRC